MEEEKETIIFDNCDMINISDIEFEENETESIFNINNNQKINSFKMSTSSKSKENKTTEESIEKREEIHEVKYNIFLALNSKCKPAKDEFEDLLKEKYLKAKRLVIQDIEISEGDINYGPKRYIFIPLKNQPNFEIDKDKIKIEKQNNKLVMKLNDKLLINEENFNKIYPNNDKIKDKNSSKKSETLSLKNSSNYDSLNSNESKSSKKSKKDNSSENEGINGDKFYKDNGENKYTKYTYFDKFEKEVDGVYYKHNELKIGEGEISLKFEDLLNDLKNNYKNDNDLNAHIIMKNFEEPNIPKDEPFMIEIKKSFELVRLLFQIKKASKMVNNLKGTEIVLPRYIICIMCSFLEGNVKGQLRQLSENNNELYNHIIGIIHSNKIKYVVGVIKDEKIRMKKGPDEIIYELGKEDFEFEEKLKRVDIPFMNQKLGAIRKDKELNEIINDFTPIYKSIGLEKKICIFLF